VKITYVHSNWIEDAVSVEWRCASVARAIRRTRRHVAHQLDIHEFVQNTLGAQVVCQSSDIIVIHRYLTGPVLSAVQRWKARDKVVLVDFDEAFDLLEPSDPSYQFWQKGLFTADRAYFWGDKPRVEPEPIAQFKWGLRQVDGATLPTSTLETDWFPSAPIHLLKDYIEIDRYRNTTQIAHDGIVIGFGDYYLSPQTLHKSGIKAALEALCQKHPRVKILITCTNQAVFDEMKIRQEQKVFVPWGTTAEWLRTLAQIDIGLAPIQGEYGQRRSWRSVLEYMLMKIPWVASEGYPYHDLASYGWLVQNNPDAWARILSDMIEHLDDYRNEAAGEPYLSGLGKDLDDNIDQVLSIYHGALNNLTAGVNSQNVTG